MKNKVTLKDIAKELGITIDAVSKALRDSNEISISTREKVKQKARELGYVKNNFASSLRSGKSKNVAVFINNLYNSYFGVMTTKLLAELNKKGYNGILFFTEGHLLKDSYLDFVYANNCAFVISLVEPVEEMGKLLTNSGIPLYVVGIKPSENYINYAITDDELGGRLVGEEFNKGNYTSALYVSDSCGETSSRRFKGFKEIAKANKIIEVAYLDDNSFAIRASQEILNNNIEFVFCFSDFVAFAVKVELAKMHLNKPITIYGYDNINDYTNTYEPVSSVKSDYDQIIKDVVKDAIDRVNKDSILDNLFKQIYPVKIVKR